MIRGVSGIAHNSGRGYSYDLLMKEGMVMAFSGSLPREVFTALEREQHSKDNPYLMAVTDMYHNWHIFDSRNTRLVLAENGEVVALE